MYMNVHLINLIFLYYVIKKNYIILIFDCYFSIIYTIIVFLHILN